MALPDTKTYDCMLAPATAGGNSEAIHVRQMDIPVSVVCPGIATGETGSLQYTHDNGSTWTACFRSNWAAAGIARVIGIDATQEHPMILDMPGIYRIVKSVTAASVGVYIKKGNF